MQSATYERGAAAMSLRVSRPLALSVSLPWARVPHNGLVD